MYLISTFVYSEPVASTWTTTTYTIINLTTPKWPIVEIWRGVILNCTMYIRWTIISSLQPPPTSLTTWFPSFSLNCTLTKNIHKVFALKAFRLYSTSSVSLKKFVCCNLQVLTVLSFAGTWRYMNLVFGLLLLHFSDYYHMAPVHTIICILFWTGCDFKFL